MSSSSPSVKLAQNLELAIDLLGRLPRDSGNLACSPYGVGEVLRVLIEGAEKSTAEELIAVLRASPGDEPRRSFSIPPAVHLAANNSLWTGKRWPVRAEYERKLAEDYGATVHTVDFERPNAVQQINAWAHRASNQRIGDIISPGSLDSLTVAVVLNSVYFRGLWASPFSPDATYPAPFYTSEGETLSVPMMTLIGDSFGYLKSSAYRAVQMPYSGDDITAIVVLPRRDRAVETLATEDLTEEGLTRLLDLRPTKVHVHLPRFRIESKWDLKNYCMRLGASMPFDSLNAGFGAIAGSGAYVSEFLQTALLECDERGTEGAAVTDARLRALGYIGGSSKPVPEFRVDRPFAFFVVHRPSACVLFAAVVERPELLET